MENTVRTLANAMYGLAAATLAGLALAFILAAIGKIAVEIVSGQPTITALLEAVSATVVSLAIFDVAKYIFEEEIMRERELRSSKEARQTLTKFLTIAIIAVTMEAIIAVFVSSKDDVRTLLYPAGLLFVVGFLVFVLGSFQRTSRLAEGNTPHD